MFLFRGDFGHVLYTGDFRWEGTGKKSEKAREMLLNALDGEVVDVLYLDNTYCNPTYCFPTRDVAAQQVRHNVSVLCNNYKNGCFDIFPLNCRNIMYQRK